MRTLLAVLFLLTSASAQDVGSLVYRTVDGHELELHVHRPATTPAPAIVFFFGGGWNSGTPEQFEPQATHLASRGMVAIRADYRVRTRHGTTPRDAVEDAQTAIAWVASHAAELGVDPQRIVAAGGSSGGHLAACTALTPWLPTDSAETRPAALALFNPVVDTGPEGYGHVRCGPDWRAISPVDHVSPAAPPTWIVHGDADRVVSFANAVRFRQAMAAADRRCDLLAWPGADHGFFNPGRGDGTDHGETTRSLERFLQSLGFLDGPPTFVSEGATAWQGYERLDSDLEVDGSGPRRLIVVRPDVEAPGRPWIWRARFFGHEPAADVELLRRGWHLVYCDVADLYGNATALALWDRAYDQVRARHGLHPKAVLEGLSRGGLPIFRWAARHPERVAGLYGDAPVCDIRSWPGGKGRGKGDEASWRACLAAHGLDEDGSERWDGDPLDVLAPIAAAGIPILLVAGDSDDVVPYAENGAELARRTRALGGQVLEMVKPGVGHHPHALRDPTPIVDFARRAYEGERFGHLRAGLAGSHARFAAGGAARVAFLGGSITHNPGWRDQVSESLRRRFPDTDFSFVNAGIPSFGSTPGAFRWRQDAFGQGPVDLLFVEAAVNDSTNGRTPVEMLRGMEGIVRGVRRDSPTTDVVLLHFADPDKIAQLARGEVPAVIAAHEAVAERYGCPSLDLAAEVTFRIQASEFTWQDDFKDLHPSPFGQALYAAAIDRLLDHAFRDADAVFGAGPHELPTPLDPDCYQYGRLVGPDAASELEGFELVPAWRPADGKSGRPGFVDVPVLVAADAHARCTLPFTGTAVGVLVNAGPDAGILEWSLDGGDWQRVDLHTRWSDGLHLPWSHVLAAGLPRAPHTLRLRSAARDAGPGGTAVRIVRFLCSS
jgi:sialidase-1